jgi:oxygen-dependent protoporphyrinogen oxidase
MARHRDDRGGATILPAVTRRQFLGGGLAVSLGGLIGGGDAEAAGGDGYKIVGWAGDEYDLPHKQLRDGAAAAEPKIWKKHDVVVVGAGLAGLSAAFKLRHMDLQVLELASEVGGNARSARYKSWDFNIGSAYIVGIEDELGKLWAEMGMKPPPIKHPLDRWYHRGRWIPDPWKDESIASISDPAFRKAVIGAKRAFLEVSKSKDFPENPYTNSTANALKLDRITFAEWLKPYAHPDLMAFIDAYGYGAMGAPASVVSAYGGINFYIDVIEERAYGYTDGNSHVAKLAASKVLAAGADRIRTGCMVRRIVPVSNDLARVYFTHKGESLGVEAKRVVLAVPYFVAARLIDGLSASQKYALGCQRYGSYVVASLCFDKVVPGAFAGYDNWTPSLKVFEDYLPIGWPDPEAEKKREADGQIIGLFAGQHSPLLARWRMITQRPESFARPMVEAFEKLFPGSKRHLRQVHMTRWGHCFIINRPGMFTRWLPSIRKQIGPIFLAHADGQGLPAIEASAGEAIATSKTILSRWGKK